MIPKAVVFDLDGTLLNSKKEISKRNFDAVSELKSKNIPIIFATARPPRATKFKGFEMLSQGGYLVYYNGAYFRCAKDKVGYHFYIPPKIGAKILDYIEEIDPNAVVTVEILDRLFGYKDIDYGVLEFMKKNYYPEMMDFNKLKKQSLTKILIVGFNCTESLVRKFSDEINVIVTDNGRLVQVMSKQVGKEIAVSSIAQNLGVEMSEVMCFGDDYNDLELFKEAGYAVAMGNAVDDIKAAATEVTLSNDEDGVAVVLEKILSQI